MKQHYLLFFSLLAVGASVLLTSNANGPASNGNFATGAPGDGATNCTSCHNGGAFGSVQVATEFINASSEFVSEYTPGEEYTINVNVSSSSGSPSAFGFQMVSLIDATEASAGSLSNASSGAKITEGNSRQYLEHSAPNSQGFFSVKWTAPTSGTGDVTFYYGSVATNGNGANSGDLGVIGSFLIPEVQGDTNDTNSNGLFEFRTADQAAFKLFPNPAQDWISISDVTFPAEVDVLDMKGNLLNSAVMQSERLDISSLESGVYFIRSGDRMARMIKL
jgi:hypothetical protein